MRQFGIALLLLLCIGLNTASAAVVSRIAAVVNTDIITTYQLDQKLQEQLAKQEFTGTEKDVWHVTSSGNIVAHSDITLMKIPQDTNIMYVKLPYPDGVLESVMLDGKSIPFSGVNKNRYELELPTTNLTEGLTHIKCIWNLPLEALTKVDKGYRIRLQGLIPVEGFELTAVLDPDCGFEHLKNPSKTRMNLFKTVGQLSMSDNASCLLSIRNCKQPSIIK